MVHEGPTRRPTIYDVATAAGVSKSLVSLVLRGSPQVSPERRAAVEAAMAQLGYRPSQAATHLARRRTSTIGVVLDDYRNLWFVELLDGLQDELAPLGYRVAVAAATLNAHVEATPLDGLLALRVDGVVIATEPGPDAATVRGTPLVVAGTREGVVPAADRVTNDDRLGAALATEHLLDLGHRRIGHLTGRGGSADVRAEGYRSAMGAAGLEPRLAGRGGETTEADGYRAAVALLEAEPSLTAIFAANDTMALGAAAAIRSYGRTVPGDISLIGYDNSALAGSYLLDLTTVDASSAEVGGEAARFLLSRIADPSLPVRARLVPPTLVRRSSTAPCPSP